MTEAEWNTCTDPQPMLEFLQGKVSDRKSRLFAVACCRRIWHLLTDERSRRVVETAERFADGGVLMDAWIDISEASHPAYLQSERVADAVKSQGVREGTEGCLNEARCHAAGAAYYVGHHYQFQTVDLPGNPKTVSSAAANAVRFERGVELGVTLNRYSHAANAGRMREAWNAEKTKQVPLIRCIFGPLPFRPVSLDPSWLTSTVIFLATAIYQERAFDRLPILADALEDSGCDSQEVLSHLRGGGEHCRGCWALDLVLGNK
jgi:hypothetical protein